MVLSLNIYGDSKKRISVIKLISHTSPLLSKQSAYAKIILFHKYILFRFLAVLMGESLRCVRHLLLIICRLQKRAEKSLNKLTLLLLMKGLLIDMCVEISATNSHLFPCH